MSGIQLREDRGVDALAFTLPVFEGVLPSAVASEVADWFGDITLLPCGWNGYEASGTVLGSGRVGWSEGRPDMGVHVSLMAEALERLPHDWRVLVGWVLNQGGKFTRADVAVDTRQVSIDQVSEAVEAGNMVMRFKSVTDIRQRRGGDGRTIAFGSRSSDSYVRIYDKAAERRAKLLAVGDPVGAAELDGVTWVRAEAEFKSDRAHEVVLGLFTGAEPASFLRAVLDFRDLSSGDQTNRCPVLPWWDDWLAGVGRALFAACKRVTDLDRMRAWIRRQAAVTLGCLVQADGGAVDWLWGIVQEGWGRAPEWKRALALAPVQ